MLHRQITSHLDHFPAGQSEVFANSAYRRHPFKEAVRAKRDTSWIVAIGMWHQDMAETLARLTPYNHTIQQIRKNNLLASPWSKVHSYVMGSCFRTAISFFSFLIAMIGILSFCTQSAGLNVETGFIQRIVERNQAVKTFQTSAEQLLPLLGQLKSTVPAKRQTPLTQLATIEEFHIGDRNPGWQNLAPIMRRVQIISAFSEGFLARAPPRV